MSAPRRAPALKPRYPIRRGSTELSDASTSTARRTATTSAIVTARACARSSVGVDADVLADADGAVIVKATTLRAASQAAGARSSVRSPPEPCTKTTAGCRPGPGGSTR